MEIIKEVKSIAAKKGITLTQIAEIMSEKLGKKFAIYELSRKLRTNTIRYYELELIMDILDRDIVFPEKCLK